MNDDQRQLPPRIARRLLRFIAPSRLDEATLGDLDEAYGSIAVADGGAAASRWYWSELLRATLPFAILTAGLARSYLRSTTRDLARHRIFSLINLSGFTISIACCILVFTWVRYELSRDSHHEKSSDIYRVVFENSKGLFAATPGGIGPAAANELPEVVRSARMSFPHRKSIRYDGRAFLQDGVIDADPALFEIFDFDFVRGDARSALPLPTSIVITTSLALKLFGSDDPIGQKIGVGSSGEFTVSAVIADPPGNSDIRPSAVLQFERIGRFVDIEWSLFGWYNFLLLSPGTDPVAASSAVADCVSRHMDTGGDSRFFLQPLGDLHLRSGPFQFDYLQKGDIRHVYIFASLAILILMIACVNYINLSAARYTGRVREIAIRKASGASRADIVSQFLGESALLALISFFSALILAAALLPMFSRLTGVPVEPIALLDLRMLSILGFAALLTGSISGSLAAFRLATSDPVRILTDSFWSGRSRNRLRTSLVVFQFILAVLFISGSLTVYAQMRYIRHRSLGFDPTDVITLAIMEASNENIGIIEASILDVPGVEGVASGFVPSGLGSWTEPWWEGKTEIDDVHAFRGAIDGDYIDFYKVELISGRSFDPTRAADTLNYIINEAAARAMRMEDPVGMRMAVTNEPGEIIGVVKDFHLTSMREPIAPFIFTNKPGELWQLNIRTDGRDPVSTIAGVRAAWESFERLSVFDPHFLEEEIEKIHGPESALEKTMSLMTIVAVLIACMGLFGLSSHSTIARTREIAVRKVLGASTAKMTWLLTFDYLKWVVLADMIALPVAWVASRRWLGGFAYRTEAIPTVLLVTALLSIIIALGTVATQSIRAAWTDPVEALKHE